MSNLTYTFAKRVTHLRPTGAFEYLSRAKELEAQGKSIIHLEIGSPDFDTPENIKDAAIKSLKDGFTKYVNGQGIIELRETVASHISKTRNIKVTPEEVVIGAGASSLIFYTILTLVNPGDEVIYPDPGFFTFEPVTILAGGKPKPFHLIEEREFSIDVDEIKDKISSRTKLLILNFPHNPTGGMILEEDLQDLANLLKDKKIWVLSDEVYSQMVYEGNFYSISSYPEMKDKTIIIDSFSKTYGMPGWRLGYAVMNKELAYKVTSLLIHCNSCTTSFIQHAGIEALNKSQHKIKEWLKVYKKRRDIIVQGLNEIPGFKCTMPKGTFYAFPNVKDLGIPSRDIALKLLNNVGVACLPGTVFGRFAEGYLRFTYVADESHLYEALDKIRKLVNSL